MKYPGFREALFTPADARGNAPHATREQADSEGRRLNAMRYETVKQAEQALDRRAARPLGAVPEQPQPSAGGLGGLVLLAGAALLGWALWRDSGAGNDQAEDEDEDEDDVLGLDAPSAPPAHTPGPFTLNVTVAPAAAGEPPKVTTTSLLPNPTPPPKKRRRKKPVEVAASAPPAPVTTPEV